MNREQTKIYTIWACLIGLLMISCGLIAVQVSKGYGQECDLLKSAPQSDVRHLKNIADARLDAMVNFAGYLMYDPKYLPPDRDNSNSFLALTLEGVEFESPWLYFNTTCARFNFLLIYQQNTDTYEAQFIYVSTRNKPKEGYFEHLCYIEPHNIVFQQTFRYACHQTIRYPCIQVHLDHEGQEHLQTVAWLVADNLEIELDGLASDYQRGRFSKDEQLCQWQ